ncbi:MAG: hypothetical protein ACREDR_12925 [Blastocatellia bacterium]
MNDPIVSNAIEAAKRLLKLISREEVARFANILGMQEDSEDADITARLCKLPRYEMVRVVLQAGTDTLLLLRDILSGLDDLGVSARTTGAVFVLANPIGAAPTSELEVSRQAAGMIATWNPDRDWGSVSAPLASLSATWRRFLPVWQELIRHARTTVVEGDLDVVQSAKETKLTGERTLIREPDTYLSDPVAQKVLRFLSARVNRIIDRLSRILSSSIPSELEFVLKDARRLVAEATKALDNPRYPRRSRGRRPQGEPTSAEIARKTSQQFQGEFERFEEDMNLLSDLVEGESLFDALRLDLWSSRPQLYEVWLLVVILQWLRGRGYKVELLRSSRTSPDSALRWHLHYAKDSSPCARVSSRDGSTFMFYQLYQPSGDMPDLVMLETDQTGSTRLWSLDAKHSEKGGYSIQSYHKTAERYQNSFGSPLSLIAEYFPLPRLGSNPYSFGEHALLIHDCKPKDAGLGVLLDQLSRCHPIIGRTLLCVDCSASFRGRLPDVLQRFWGSVNDAGSAETFLDEFVFFAEEAMRCPGLARWLKEGGQFPNSPQLADGTASAPLIDIIRDIGLKGTLTRTLTGLVLLTDGQLDITVADLTRRIKEQLQVEPVIFG